MSGYTLGSALLSTRTAYVRAICDSWLYAGGWNSDADIAKYFRDYTDSQLAGELAACWLSEPEQNPHDVSLDELTEAMSEFRTEFSS